MSLITPSQPSPPNPPGIFGTLVKLWPYIWPKARRDLKTRVFVALALLVVAKLVTIVVPYTFK